MQARPRLQHSTMQQELQDNPAPQHNAPLQPQQHIKSTWLGCSSMQQMQGN